MDGLLVNRNFMEIVSCGFGTGGNIEGFVNDIESVSNQSGIGWGCGNGSGSSLGEGWPDNWDVLWFEQNFIPKECQTFKTQ